VFRVIPRVESVIRAFQIAKVVVMSDWRKLHCTEGLRKSSRPVFAIELSA
jgi:hypothetical protein